MTRTRRLVGAGLASLATLAALTFAGQGLAAERQATGVPGLSPQRLASTISPDDDGSGRGRGQGGYPPGEVPSVPPATPPGGEVPSVPPATPPGEVPSVPPGGEVPSVPPGGGVPGQVPRGGELPVTGLPMAALALMGALLAVAGVGVRLVARRRRSC